jgi:hypothetical protein
MSEQHQRRRDRLLGAVAYLVVAGIMGTVRWLVERMFGPFRIPEWVYAAAAFIGLAMFVAIGVSRHPEAYKVRLFGAVVAGAFVVALLVGAVVGLLHHRP